MQILATWISVLKCCSILDNLISTNSAANLQVHQVKISLQNKISTSGLSLVLLTYHKVNRSMSERHPITSILTMLSLLTMAFAKRPIVGFVESTLKCRNGKLWNPKMMDMIQTRTLKINPNTGRNGGSSALKMSDNSGSSWMEKNEKGSSWLESDDEPTRSTFRDNFRGTRVFVQGIPTNVSWQTLKDHFRTAGNVVFASVSIDRDTNQSKGHGIVQFETEQEAKNAILIMRDYPMEDEIGNMVNLYVRPDHQESKNADATYRGSNRFSSQQDQQLRSLWKCANDSEDDLSMEERTMVLNIIKARDASRKRKNFDAADAMREQLKQDYDIHLDDRLKLWWKDVSIDGRSAVPNRLNEIKGEGHWKNKADEPREEWRQIPTTPEKDACVDPNLVNALLTQRDIARMEKDFYTADKLLDEATYTPNVDGFKLRIHDASRTWRVWSDEPPQKEVRNTSTSFRREPKGPIEQCLELVEKYDPDKKGEVMTLLKKFPGREYNILKKLKQRYSDEDGDEY